MANPAVFAVTIIVGLIYIVFVAGSIILLVLLIRALLKYLRTKDVREEKSAVKRTLGETIRAHRTRCQMTQEFVAESIGVSRQAVSKWEQGISDPSTSNLFALAKLFDVPVEELLKDIQ